MEFYTLAETKAKRKLLNPEVDRVQISSVSLYFGRRHRRASGRFITSNKIIIFYRSKLRYMYVSTDIITVRMNYQKQKL